MTDRDEPFWPESLTEHLNQLAQDAPHSPGPPLPEVRLVEDLRTVYTEYTRAGERVWERLAEHLAERDHTPTAERRKASERGQAASVEPLPVEHGQFAPPSLSPRRSGRMFTLVAAVLVAAVLVGSAFSVLTGRHQPGTETAVASVTPTVTPMPALAFHCPQPPQQTPRSPAAFYALCNEQKIQVIQQSYKVHGRQTLTLVAGYADRTVVTLWFHIDKNADVTLDGSASSAQQASGAGTFSIGTGGCDFGNPNGPLDCLEFFALQHVPSGLQVLNLEIQESVGTGLQDQAPVLAVFRVSLPVHADR